MKEIRSLDEWDMLSWEEKKEALREHPELKQKILIAAKWMDAVRDYKEELKELMA